MKETIRKTCIGALATGIILLETNASAEIVQFEATFAVDGKTDFDPGDTVILNGADFDNVQLGDQFTIHFFVDTDLTDSDDRIEVNDNVLLAADSRIGRFGGVLSALQIVADAANAGSFDPSGIGISSSTVSSTADAVAVYKTNNAIANKEVIRLLAATNPAPGVLGGELTDIVMNFSNIQPLGAANPEDYLDDRSVTVDPFDFNDLFQGPSQIAGNVRDLIYMDDDIQGTGFEVNDLNRPMALRFGEADILPANGASYQKSVYVWGTLVSISLPAVPPLLPLPTPGPTPMATPTATPIASPALLAQAAPVPLPNVITLLLIAVLGYLGLRRV
ncbi:hypothetical protein [Pseudohalioglobus lutimaris]|nr:hypothetical protein [Pseudohalioglobus lutimaris]